MVKTDPQNLSTVNQFRDVRTMMDDRLIEVIAFLHCICALLKEDTLNEQEPNHLKSRINQGD